MTVEQKEKKVPKSKTKMQTCPTCGTVFETVKGKYCSKECKKTIDANCIECGKPFKAGKKSEQWCSTECRDHTAAKKKSEQIRLSDPEAIQCLECGLYIGKSLSQHLAKHNMTATEYRKKWNVGAEAIESPSLLAYKSNKFKGSKNPGYQHGGKLSPFSEHYVKYEGDDAETMAKKIAEVRTKAIENRISPTSLEYYLLKGYDQITAQAILRDRQTTFNLEKCIEKYGEDEGYKRWKLRQDKWQETLASKSFEERERYTQLKTLNSQIALELLTEVQMRMGNPADARFGLPEGGYGGEKMVEISIGGKSKDVMLDYCLGNKVIEFNGDFWHANPELYDAEDRIIEHRGVDQSAADIWDRDKVRNEALRDLGYNVLIIWESEYRKDKEATVQKCVDFLKA